MLELTFEQLRKFALLGERLNDQILVGIDANDNPLTEMDLGDSNRDEWVPVKIGDYVFEGLGMLGNIEHESSSQLMGFLADGRIIVYLSFIANKDEAEAYRSRTLLVNEKETGSIFISRISFMDDRVLQDDDDQEAQAVTVSKFTGKVKTPVIVIDLESLATDPNAAILEMGAVFGDLSTGELFGYFRELVDRQQPGRTVDLGTVKWHRDLQKKNKLIGTLWQDEVGDEIHLTTALATLAEWIKPIVKAYPDTQIITNGPEFDASVLATAYKSLGANTPWDFRNNQSLRTFRFMAEQLGVTGPADAFAKSNQTMAHNALYDAWREFKIAALQHQAILNKSLKELSTDVWAAAIPVQQFDESYEVFKALVDDADLKLLKHMGMPQRIIDTIETGEYVQLKSTVDYLAAQWLGDVVRTPSVTYYRTSRGLWFAF